MAARNVLVLAFDGVQLLDVAGPLEVFDEANRFSGGAPTYRVVCVGVGGGPVRASNGLALDVRAFTSWRDPIDTLVVPGGTLACLDALLSRDDLVGWLQAAASRARRVASVCTGALLLAGCDLLRGRRATTHWGAIDALRTAAPDAVVEADSIYTRDRGVYTSAGVTAGIDLALALVEEDLGRRVATAIARNLVLYLRRPGGQSQFSEPLRAQSRVGGRLAHVVDHVLARPDADLSVEQLAERACMSPRHFSRAFRAATGEPPARFVARARLEAARIQLGESTTSVATIAERCGFTSADVLARRFRSRFGITPSDYRRAFGSFSARE